MKKLDADSPPLLKHKNKPQAPSRAATFSEVTPAGLVQLPTRTGSRAKGWIRKIHALVGLVSCLNLMIILITGLLIQHRDAFRLDGRMVSRQFLPDSYRSGDGPGGVRADIVVTDLHSGRIFGSTGALILDVITVAWFVLLLSGLLIFSLGRPRKKNGFLNGNGG